MGWGRASASACLLALLLASSPLSTMAESGDSAPIQADSLNVVIIDSAPHDPAAYTQGLAFRDGRLFESTGRYGESTLREVEPVTGEVLRNHSLNGSEFGEGLTIVGDEILQLTWRENVLHRYRWDTFEVLGNHTFSGEGWGLAHDGQRLIMSNGSDQLTYRNVTTFEVEGTLNVTLNGTPVQKLNELEVWQGLILANVYQSDHIVGIDPASGIVVLDIDASGLRTTGGKELNGIAWDATTDSLWITGKDWSLMYSITFEAPPRYEPDPVEDNPDVQAQAQGDVSVILVAMGLLVLMLLAMNLKDGERNGEERGGSP